MYGVNCNRDVRKSSIESRRPTNISLTTSRYLPLGQATMEMILKSFPRGRGRGRGIEE